MRIIIRKSILLLIVTLAVILSSCALNVKSIRRQSETVETSATIPAETARPTKKPTVTPTPTQRPSPTATPSPTRIPTPIPSATPIPLEEYNMYGYIITDAISVRDEDGNTVSIPEGQFIRVFSLDYYGYYDEFEIVGDTDRFFLGDTEFFPVFSTNEYGTVCVSDIPAYELFRTVEQARSPSKPEAELKPGVQLKDLNQYERVKINVDWDGDGVTDEISIILKSWSWVLRFQNGSSGSIKYSSSSVYEYSDYEVMMEYIEKNWGEQDFNYSEDPSAIGVLNFGSKFPVKSVLLYQNSSGENIIMVGANLSTFCTGDYMPITGFIRYSPTEIFSIEKVVGVFEYENKKFYKDNHSVVFGKSWTTKKPIRLNDDFSYEYLSENEEYLAGHRKCTYSLRPVNIEVIGAASYDTELLPAGNIVIPKRTEFASDGSGYVYFTLLDGRSARVRFLWDSGKEVIRIDGQPQEEVFRCYYFDFYWGG